MAGSKACIFIGVFLLMVVAAAAAGAMGQRPAANGQWQPFYFDGAAFRPGEGTGTATVQLREGYLPVVRHGGGPVPEQRLQGENGALAVFCYMQTAGGKLRDAGGFLPMEGLPLRITGEREIPATTDTHGFFVMELPPGEYEVRAQGMSRSVRVEKGKSSLIAIRGGKRMVD